MEEQEIILSHPTGNANVRAVAQGLLNQNMLKKFYTCVAVFENHPCYPITGMGPLKEFRKRVFSDELRSYTEVRPFKEIGRLLSKKAGNWGLRHFKDELYSIDNVYKDLDFYVSQRLTNTKAVYAYEDGAIETFKQATKRGITRFYDLPIGYWRSMHLLLEEERQNRPEWAATIEGLKDPVEKLSLKDEELQFADRIFVASSFTASTLEMFPGALAPVQVIPYGFPPAANKREYIPLKNRKLKVLFVGGLSQRKGISYLFEAVNQFKEKIELTIVGEKPVRSCEVLNKNLQAHKWIRNLAHADVLDLMKTQDLLVFPSLFEGFGLVITEAMSQGTPVITTDRTCGIDLLAHGENGWLIEAGSTGALVRQLEEIFDKPYLTEEVGRAALQTAMNRPWHVYGSETAAAIQGTYKEDKTVC